VNQVVLQRTSRVCGHMSGMRDSLVRLNVSCHSVSFHDMQRDGGASVVPFESR
jgi:hypothetical protein